MSRANRKLTVVTQAGLYAAWPKIQSGLEYVRRLGVSWHAGDVYHKLRTSEAVLITGDGDDFVVVTEHSDFSGPSLWVWVVYARRGITPRYWAEFGEFMKKRGVTRLLFSSTRPGWARLARRYGEVEATIMYEIDTVVAPRGQ